MVNLVARAQLPTAFGEFEVYAFTEAGKEHLVLVKGPLTEEMNVRIHSKCQTGDALNSLRCDCRKQLEKAMKYCAKHTGVIIYLDQEGRGIGLANKIKAYELQDQGLDTVEANEKLGFQGDLRDNKTAADILKSLGMKGVHLLTNNPEKIQGLETQGVHVIKRIPLNVRKSTFNEKYLKTKKEKMKHLVE